MITHRLFGLEINDLKDSELDQKLEQWVLTGNHVIFTPNAEMLLRARREPWFLAILERGDLLLPDSISIKYAIAALSDSHLQNRHTGIDTLQKIMEICQQANRKVVLLGGVSYIAKKAIERLRFDYPRLDVEMVDPGDVKIDSDGKVLVAKSVVDEIKRLRPSVLAVALGHGKQEAFILKYIHDLEFINIAIGVGGAIDMIAGHKQRAPKTWRRLGLEWFWRLLIEPSRIGRIMQASVVFPLVVAREAQKERRFIKACLRVGREVAHQFFKK